MFFTLVESLVWSATLVSLITLCGLGLVNLIGLRGMRDRVLLAPGLFVAAVTLLVGSVVHLRIPVEHASPFIWIIFVVLGIYGIKGLRVSLESCRLRRMLALGFCVSVIVLGGFEWFGIFDYLGSPNQDGWTCVAFGEYLRLYARGITGGLAPVYQYGSHLANSRFVESAMLALFIPPWSDRIDTQMMVGPFLLIMVFSFACSTAYVAQVVNEKGLRNLPEVSLLLSVFGGWFPFAMLANNYGNLVVLSFSPILFGAAIDRTIVGYSRYLMPGAFFAAAIYIYPELCILVIAPYFIASIGDLSAGKYRQKALLWLSVIAVTVLLVNFYLPEAVGIFFHQLSTTQSLVGGRPGNGFAPDLLVNSRLPAALWGFEQIQIFKLDTGTVGLLLGGLLSIITAFGLSSALRTKVYPLVLCFVTTVGLVMWMIFSKRYDYGAYKVLLIGWWATSLLLSVGLRVLWSSRSAAMAQLDPVFKVLIVATLIAASVLWGNQQFSWMNSFAYKQAQPLREVRDYLKSMHEAVTVSISDPILNAWMVFELRSIPVLYSEYNGYMGQSHVLPFMARSAVPKQVSDYLLVAKTTLAVGNVVWSNALFSIFKNNAGSTNVLMGKIEAKNGLEHLDGSSFFWLGRDAVTLNMTSSVSQLVFLHTDVVGGPSVRDPSRAVTIEIYVNGVLSDRLSLSDGSAHSIKLNLHSGSNSVVFKSIYSGGFITVPNGDPRILIAGVELRALSF